MIEGVYIPIITPFKDGKVDFDSLRKLIQNYLDKGIHGIMPLATTGEVPAIDADEYKAVLEAAIDEVKGSVPVYAGVSGNATWKMIKQLKSLDAYDISGFLVTAPYYNLPSQEGIHSHFKALAENTDKDIVIYNIPYRTGRNMENETIFKLAEIPNIVGIKDSCGNPAQSVELITQSSDDFSVMTGEDIFFLANLCHGGSGGILASAHLKTEDFVKIYNHVRANDLASAQGVWKKLFPVIPLLFKEPNPAPVKYLLYRDGQISSDEVRGPLCGISEGLKKEFGRLL